MAKLLQIRTLTIALGLANAVSSFSLPGALGPRSCRSKESMRMSTSPDASTDNDEEPRLVLGNMEAEMQNVRANSGVEYDFGAIDFLANAKARAASKVESINSASKNDDWTRLAEEKKEQVGEIDDWENSQKEAGNADSQILMFTDPPPDGEGGEGGGEGGDEGGEDEPKLLLF
jgi:hypothetical protein